MIERALQLIAWSALGSFIGVVLLQHLVSSELRPDEHVISEYATTDAGPLMVVGFVAWSVAFAATSVLTWRRGSLIRPDRGSRMLALCLALAAAGALVTAIFETQAVASVVPPGTPRTTAGRLHDGGSGLLSVSLLLACAASVRAIGFARGFRRTALALLVLAVVADVVLLAVGDPVPGARQRVLVATACGWHIALLAQLSRPELFVR